MSYDDRFLDKKLNERKDGNFLRRLVLPPPMVDFCSNDYLGIATNRLLKNAFSGDESHGSRGARTLAGNYPLLEETEQFIADFHEAEAALIFNSGYTANTGLIAAVAQRGDAIFYDSLSHASIRDGVRLSFADAFSFQHNDLDDLEKQLISRRQKGTSSIFIVTESVFSMDGDQAPLAGLVSLSKKYDAHLLIDEAHAIGVSGNRGEGLAQSQSLHHDIFARIYTYGKAPGVHGAAVTGSARLKSYLVNFARSFIYTTALPEVSVKAISASYHLFPQMQKGRDLLKKKIDAFQSATISFEKLKSNTPIQGIVVPGNDQVKALADFLQSNKLDVRPILYPSVPRGRERLRISLHSFNSDDELGLLLDLLKT